MFGQTKHTHTQYPKINLKFMNNSNSILKFSKFALTGIVLSSLLIFSSLGYDFVYATHETNENQDNAVELENDTTNNTIDAEENISDNSDNVSSSEDGTSESTGCTIEEFGGRLSIFPANNLDLFGFEKVQQIVGFGGVLSDIVNENDCLETLDILEVNETEPEITVELYLRTNSEVVNFVEVFEDMKVIRETGYPPFSITGVVTLSESILHPSTYVLYGLNSKSNITDKFEVVLDVNMEESKFKNIIYNNCYLTKSHIAPMDTTDINTSINNQKHSYYVDSFEFSCKGFTSSEFS